VGEDVKYLGYKEKDAMLLEKGFCRKTENKNSFTEKGITKLGTGKTLSKILNKRLSLD